MNQYCETWKNFYYDHIERGCAATKAAKLADKDYERYEAKRAEQYAQTMKFPKYR